VPLRVVVALVGDPQSEAFDFTASQRPYRELQKLELEAHEDETLGSVLGRAAARLGADLTWIADWETGITGPAFVAFYRSQDEERGPQPWLTLITLVDGDGHAIWNVPFARVPYSELLRSAEAGALEGDPLRPYLILHPPAGDGLAASWELLVNLWDLAYYVLDHIEVAITAGIGITAIADRIRRQIRNGREVVQCRFGQWRERAGDPATVATLLANRPRSTPDVARLLDCSEEEAEAILWAFGFAPGDGGLWRRDATEDAKLLRGNFELIVHGYDDVELQRRFRERYERFLMTGEAPEVEWPGLTLEENETLDADTS
jgi:hypothetical protein